MEADKPKLKILRKFNYTYCKYISKNGMNKCIFDNEKDFQEGSSEFAKRIPEAAQQGLRTSGPECLGSLL